MSYTSIITDFIAKNHILPHLQNLFYKRGIRATAVSVLLSASLVSMAKDPKEPVDSTSYDLDEVVVINRDKTFRVDRPTNTTLISSAELKRAACCNLGESFTTNPSVDVSYNDAATGARQIRLLGLSGSYVQMLTENIPNFRIAAAPYGLGYVPGPWMQSIQVSKGASSVKNGYESITGQINVEMKKPQGEEQYALNGYVDYMGKVEANADANWHLSDKLSTGLLAHFENSFAGHDMNDDGFLDMPRIRQVTVMDRWAWLGQNYVFQAAVRFLDEHRRSGQHSHDGHSMTPSTTQSPSTASSNYTSSSNSSTTSTIANEGPYKININTRRWEGFTKNAYIFDHENDGNVALILSGNGHNQESVFGDTHLKVDHLNLYASLMFEKKFSGIHSISTGLSLNYDHLDNRFIGNRLSDVNLGSGTVVNGVNQIKWKEKEAVTGGYFQYTLNLDSKLLAMAGVRYDYSSLYGSMFTPRMHLKYTPIEQLTIHGSAGKGYRSPHALAENSYLLASSRQIVIQETLDQEQAWNFGIGADATLRVFDRKLTLGAEYYYTDFRHQLLIDYDTDVHKIYFRNLNGKSFSHTVQIEANYQIIDEINATVAWRMNDVKSDYGWGLIEKPLVPKHKWLLTASYEPMMGIWQFDCTLAVNGSGRLPNQFGRFKAFPQLNAQATRNFRHFSIYLGGENLTGYRQPNPIIGAQDPFGPDFDATMIYGPLHGAIVYVGFRYNFVKY